MVGKQKETAEQKLLKMIEVSSGDGLSAGKSHQKTVKKQDAVALLKVFNIFLILGVLISFGLLANEVKAGLDLANQSVEINTSSSGVDRGRDTPLDPLVQNVGFYLSATSVRNLFVPYQEVVVKATVRQSEDMAIVRKTKNFKLVGISWFDHAAATSLIPPPKPEMLIQLTAIT